MDQDFYGPELPPTSSTSSSTSTVERVASHTTTRESIPSTKSSKSSYSSSSRKRKCSSSSDSSSDSSSSDSNDSPIKRNKNGEVHDTLNQKFDNNRSHILALVSNPDILLPILSRSLLDCFFDLMKQ